jgi:hypothetical protein
MMSNNFLTATELDFNSLKNNLKQYLSGQQQFADYNFDASNMSVLIDLLTYNTYLSNFYLNMVGSEMFLDTAQLRESIVSHAKELNYIPRSRTSAKAQVNIRLVPTDNPSYIIIPKFYQVTTSIDNTTITFSTDSEHILYPTANGYVAANASIYEGSVVTEYFTASNTAKYRMQSEKIDTNSIEVTVINSNVDSSNSVWSLSENLYGLSPTSNVYFLQGYSANQYELVFGNDVTGKSLSTGNIVKVRYRDTIGEKGNGAYRFSKGSAIQGYSNITITTVTSAVEGSERESNDSIKFNGTRFFTTQERAVTAVDYANLTKAKFPQLQSVIAYGGEELNPPQYGRVGVSVKPYGTAGLISDSLKSEIVSYLNNKSITTQTIVIDPEYYYVKVDSTITYNSSVTLNSAAQISALVQSAILNYGTSYLTDFGSDLRYSKLIGVIDSADSSIVSNDTQLKMIKRWSPTVGTTSTTSFSFNNPLHAETILYSLPQGHALTLYSSNFSYTTADGTLYNAFFADNGLGIINIYTNVSTSSGVTRSILADTVGTVDYSTGTVTISANISGYTGSYISIYGRLENADIYSITNKFLLIEASDISITINPVTA